MLHSVLFFYRLFVKTKIKQDRYKVIGIHHIDQDIFMSVQIKFNVKGKVAMAIKQKLFYFLIYSMP